VSSFTSSLLSELESEENVEDEIEIIKNCAGLAYAGRLFTIIKYTILSYTLLQPALKVLVLDIRFCSSSDLKVVCN